ncbi:MAG TPA: molybdopterin-guanine dinucleotide biosynthesis protein B [Syntrophomonadaceae bacterium]|nr:molybdopterin-guanine dinucleotide biosynthesis protein B [Syntrophomonadaceae bacterium]
MTEKSNIPIISFIAKSGSGKTTLLEKVIRQLKSDGYRIAVIKHDAHRFDMDKPGKDSWRIAEAGADVVAISSPGKVAMIEKVNNEKSLEEVIDLLPDVDLILTEGFKQSGKPAIEVSRSEVHRDLLPEPVNRLAIASDVYWDIGVPCYDINDASGIVSEIKKYVAGLKKAKH